MKNNRTTALLMLLVFLLVVAVVIIFLTGLDRNTNSGNPYENVTVTTQPEAPVETPEATPVPTTAPTSAPVYYPPTTAAPVHTATPVQGGGAGQAAIPAQAATPAPTPTPVTAIEDGGILPVQQLIPVVPGVNDGASTGDAGNTIPIGTVIGSGQFRSDTGTALNIHADWTASINDPQSVNVTVTVFADHYSLMTTATPGALQVSVDGQYVSLGSPAIENDGTTGLAMTQINSHTFQVPLTSGDIRTVPVQVVWQYRGSYSGVDLPTIECGGSITVTR